LALFDATALDMMKVGFFAMEDFSDFSKKFVKIQRMKFYVLRLPNEVRSERDRQIFFSFNKF
jgi:hypothetical protein